MINIKRDTSNPPLGLAKEKQKEINGGEGNYRCEDVVSRIKYDFYNKCYIMPVNIAIIAKAETLIIF